MKERTPTQKLKRYKRISRLCFAGEFVSTATPFVALGIANYDKYFVQYNGTKMSIACFLAMAVMGLAIWLVAKKKFTNSFITLVLGWATFTIIFYLLGEIITDLAFIMACGLVGILGALGLDIGSKSALKKAEEVQKGIDKAKEEMIADEYKEEKKYKIKVK